MTEEAESAEIPMDKLARVYRKIRDEKQRLSREYEGKIAELEGKLDQLKIAMKDQMLRLGTTSMRTNSGTVSLAKHTKYSTNDWDSFKQFIMEHDAVDLLEKRVAQINMATFLEENPGVVPPGLNSLPEYSISVRKPSN